MKISEQLNPIYLAVLLLFCTQLAAAQLKMPISPGTLARQNQLSLWKNSGNPAGLQYDKPFQYASLVASYEAYGGDFNRPQAGSSGSRQSLETEGNLFNGGYYLTGNFSYIRDNIRNANYNASIIDPFRGMPYIIADLNPSNWMNQHYKLQFNIATPQFYDRLSFGLAGSYIASSGAKQRDIRAENYNYNLTVKPGLVYSPSKNHHMGFDLTYSNVKEESAMRNVNVYIYQPFYELLGLGNAISRFGDGSVYNYEGDGVGAALQYHFEGETEIFMTAAYKVEAEDLQESFQTPRKVGSVLRRIWDTRLTLQNNGERHSHILNLTYFNRGIEGIQYITQRDNEATQQGWLTLLKNIRSTYALQRVGANYSVLANRDKEYAWKIDAGLTYEKMEDKYMLPNSILTSENLLTSLKFEKSIILSDRKAKRLSMGTELAYNANTSGHYNYSGEHADLPTVTGLTQNDFNYLSSDYLSVGIPITYAQQLKEQSNKTFFVKASGRYIHTDSYNYRRHYLMSIQAGFNF